MFAVHYRFKSSRNEEFSAVTFDGPFISLGELKSRIIEANKLGNSDDFDLHVVNAQTEEGAFLRTLQLTALRTHEVERFLFVFSSLFSSRG